MKYKKILSTLIVCFSTLNIFAAFKGTERSVTNTAETLPQFSGQIGFLYMMLGITDNLMLKLPSFYPLSQGGRNIRLKYKLIEGESFIVSPEIKVNKAYTQFEYIYTLHNSYYVGETKNHSFSLGLKLADQFPVESGATLASSTIDTSQGKSISFQGYLAYDYYTDSNNIFFMGVEYDEDYLPYLGFTAAWDHLHTGFVFFLGEPYILPYIYVRF
ncbi:MAG: hypothetical protein CMP11_03440 [Zetaproteobacteria bacterium]|nr:hypothetical protein [Pseudobdellovibrionaceae bacterium]|tara:strand:- start:260 stop:904 length:645 start_codon:yes stop_codon:yes gene_type:complete